MFSSKTCQTTYCHESIADFKQTILEKIQDRKNVTARKIHDEISQNCISCDTSILSSQTNSQEYKITSLNAFHSQIKSKVRSFNKNKIVSTQSKMYIFKS